MIILPIKKKWFDMIVCGIKQEEYRAITPRYFALFNKAADANNCFICMIRNGYSKNSPSAIIHVQYSIGYGNPNWGAEPNTKYYVLKILSVVNVLK